MNGFESGAILCYKRYPTSGWRSLVPNPILASLNVVANSEHADAKREEVW